MPPASGHHQLSGITPAEAVTAQFFSQKAGKKRRIYRNEERETHVEHQSENFLISESEIRELPDNKVLIICDNHKTTMLDVKPSYTNSRFKRMMRYSPVIIRSKVKDKLSFIPLWEKIAGKKPKSLCIQKTAKFSQSETWKQLFHAWFGDSEKG